MVDLFIIGYSPCLGNAFSSNLEIERKKMVLSAPATVVFILISGFLNTPQSHACLWCFFKGVHMVTIGVWAASNEPHGVILWSFWGKNKLICYFTYSYLFPKDLMLFLDTIERVWGAEAC